MLIVRGPRRLPEDHPDGTKVTLEVIPTRLGLERDPGLARIGALVHYLDVGGIPYRRHPPSRPSCPAPVLFNPR